MNSNWTDDSDDDEEKEDAADVAAAEAALAEGGEPVAWDEIMQDMAYREDRGMGAAPIFAGQFPGMGAPKDQGGVEPARVVAVYGRRGELVMEINTVEGLRSCSLWAALWVDEPTAKERAALLPMMIPGEGFLGKSQVRFQMDALRKYLEPRP
jgi:hypothetical protein